MYRFLIGARKDERVAQVSLLDNRVFECAAGHVASSIVAAGAAVRERRMTGS